MILNSPYISGSLTVTGNTTLQGALTVTGSLSGTASTASFALTLDGTGSVGFATTGAFAATSGSASSRLTQIEQVYATTGSNSFRATQSITGSLTVTGQIIAQTLNVQQVTSSIVYSSGSNVFGCDINSRQTFTGSFYQTGSVAVFNSCVGIGKINPIARLDVSGSHTPGYGILNITSNDSAILSLDSPASADIRIRFKQSGVDKWFAGTYNNENWDLRIGDNTPRFTVTQCGRVGIGTTDPPSTQLAVVADWISGNATVKTYPITPISSGGASGYGIFDSNGTSRKAYFAANATQVEVWGQQNTPMVLATNDIVRLSVDSSGRVTFPYQPSFYAYGVSNGTYGSGNYWIFPTTQHNRGSHYNTSNGIFTAPVAGVYFFAFGNLMGTEATVYRWYLRVNNSNTGAGPSIQLRMDRTGYSTSSYGWSHSKTAVISLAAGDTVRIYSTADNGSNLFPGGDNATEEYPHFMGFLMG